jgi:hypothetical protein
MILHLLHIFLTDALTFILPAPHHQAGPEAGLPGNCAFASRLLFGPIGNAASA